MKLNINNCNSSFSLFLICQSHGVSKVSVTSKGAQQKQSDDRSSAASSVTIPKTGSFRNEYLDDFLFIAAYDFFVIGTEKLN